MILRNGTEKGRNWAKPVLQHFNQDLKADEFGLQNRSFENLLAAKDPSCIGIGDLGN